MGRKLVRYNIADLDAWLMAHRVEVSVQPQYGEALLADEPNGVAQTQPECLRTGIA
ncbi:hypothetical protein [Tsukamurella tyrosinosolvens]|uniref:hypothetical protein n=1 Tax=Tsukamurella tyrosinosolvens TaxID=57704 RepID=UPI001374D214|nr:hypothetical protein [Tsukamurella tyrosinosolvens]